MSEVPPDLNRQGFSKIDYQGGKSTLCTGCGHDSVTQHIINAFYETGINPRMVAKVSGIGCSSKTPAYFLSQAHGFNSLHGRMASVALGAKVANRKLTVIGVSGDGDTASIGLGGFAHLIRRNLPMVYLVENNGVYGLTKGQFSATADKGSASKQGSKNPFSSIDLCGLALELGCGFVARSFSGDGKQLVALLKAALHHQGTAFIDIVSPCVAFANHPGSTKSFGYVKDHKVILQELGITEPYAEIKVEYDPGSTTEVKLPDGAILTLKKLHHEEHDCSNLANAMTLLQSTRENGEIVTGLLYLRSDEDTFLDRHTLTETPLCELQEVELRPPESAIDEILGEFR